MPDLNIVLFEPEIPQNTGNIARTCACVGARLHLVEPMGFRLTDKHLGRAGLDYWDQIEINRYSCVEQYMEKMQGKEQYFFTGQAKKSMSEPKFGEEVYLIFGRESRGIDPVILEKHKTQCVRIPMREGLRSLNVSNAVAIGAYEVLRAWSYPGLT